MQGVEVTSQVRSILITSGSDGALSLKKGDILATEVLRNLGSGKVSLKIAGKVIEAKSEAPLKAGDRVLLKVEESTGKEVRLKILPRSGTGAATEVKAAIEKMLTALKGERMNSQSLAGFKSMLTRVPTAVLARVPELGVIDRLIRSAGKLSGKEVKELIKGSGIFFEAGLKGAATGGNQSVESLLRNDLKGALLRLLSQIKDEELIKELLKVGIKPTLLEEGVEKLLKSIEYHQFQSKLNDTIDIFLTFYWKGLLEGSLIISDERSSAGGEESSSCTLNLHLETLGRISTGLLLNNECLYITFLAEKPDSAAIIEAAAGELIEGLSHIGFKAINIKTRVVPEIDFSSREQRISLSDAVDLRI